MEEMGIATSAHSPNTHSPLEVQLGAHIKSPHMHSAGLFPFKLSQPKCLAQTSSAPGGITQREHPSAR